MTSMTRRVSRAPETHIWQEDVRGIDAVELGLYREGL